MLGAGGHGASGHQAAIAAIAVAAVVGIAGLGVLLMGIGGADGAKKSRFAPGSRTGVSAEDWHPDHRRYVDHMSLCQPETGEDESAFPKRLEAATEQARSRWTRTSESGSPLARWTAVPERGGMRALTRDPLAPPGSSTPPQPACRSTAALR